MDDFYQYSLRSLNPYIDEIMEKDSHIGKGELKVVIPQEVQKDIRFHEKTFDIKVQIHFSVRKPNAGYTFFTRDTSLVDFDDFERENPSNPSNQNKPDRPKFQPSPEDHLYISSNSVPGTARQCFPCIDTWSALCTWTIEISVKEGMVGIASGTLVNDVPLNNGIHGRKRVFSYDLKIPSIAAVIGICVGTFVIHNPEMKRIRRKSNDDDALDRDRDDMDDPNTKDGNDNQGNKPTVSDSSIKHICPPTIASIMKQTVKHTPNDAMCFYEDLLSDGISYPYKEYRQIFVYNSPKKFMNFAGMSILDSRILHSDIIMDTVIDTRKVLGMALAYQFFGTYIIPDNDSDIWITAGLAGHWVWEGSLRKKS